jgi:hypothetical protein
VGALAAADECTCYSNGTGVLQASLRSTTHTFRPSTCWSICSKDPHLPHRHKVVTLQEEDALVLAGDRRRDKRTVKSRQLECVRDCRPLPDVEHRDDHTVHAVRRNGLTSTERPAADPCAQR